MLSAKLAKAVLCAVVLASYSLGAPAGSSAPAASSVLASSSAPVPSASAALSSLVSSAVPSAATSAVVPSSAASSFPASISSNPSSTASASVSADAATETVPYASDNANGVMWNPGWDGQPEAIRGSLGSSVIGPQNNPMDLQNPDLLAPPTTDAGTVGNAKWPFSLSHNRLQTGGWARQQNLAVLPMASAMAGVDMRLEVGAIRELHWHKTGEWAYILQGSVQISAVNQNGQNFVSTINQGDLWYFPAGIPHSIQATDANANGAEFLLVFDDGNFSEDDTFLLTDWLAHVPKDVLAKNFQTSMSTFDKLPGQELYIFPAAPPGPDSDAPTSPQGTVPNPFTFKLSEVPATQLQGGSVKIVDSNTFTASKTIAAAEVTVEPGAMRELHWHPTQDEWSYFIEGYARVTLFAAQSSARTFDYQAGDVGYVPGSYGHYVENIGNTTLRYLEVFKTDTFQDVSLSQWLALTPSAMVKATLNLDDEDLSHFSKTKPVVVGASNNS
ncbi:oxalate decarboxylase family bicupin [Phanerochaete sordida]|uniref:Oxalate decarboxylase family bicupin n=1 Tax=Phanerochaete sordida TaxID=48140 RepID=A0A9P3G090_9APHY|nr:oxalate decarboxylase family bicupin [Phanerochaete sordida]